METATAPPFGKSLQRVIWRGAAAFVRITSIQPPPRVDPRVPPQGTAMAQGTFETEAPAWEAAETERPPSSLSLCAMDNRLVTSLACAAALLCAASCSSSAPPRHAARSEEPPASDPAAVA